MAGSRSFKVTEQANVPTGRNGKHKAITTRILDDLDGLESNKALKIPLSELPDTKVNIRSALNRAGRKIGRWHYTCGISDHLSDCKAGAEEGEVRRSIQFVQV